MDLKCRSCKKPTTILADLGHQPLSNQLVCSNDTPIIFYPLKAYICESCKLTQLSYFVDPEVNFSSAYPYFASYNPQTVASAKAYVDEMCEYQPKTWLEIASNDGYLLQFVKEKKIEYLGIEPTQSTAQAAIEKGINTIYGFYDSYMADRLGHESWDIITCNNVLAHVPDLHNFISGIKKSLTLKGVATFEFHWLVDLIKKTRFDTIYHEHYYYLSATALDRIFSLYDLDIFKIEQLHTHGFSLRLYVGHKGQHDVGNSVQIVKDMEARLVAITDHKSQTFQDRMEIKSQRVKQLLLENRGHIFGYGAPAKATVMLNYCNIKSDQLPFVVDKSPYKQGKFIPGTGIRIVSPEFIGEKTTGLCFPWNLKEEIQKEFPTITMLTV